MQINDLHSMSANDWNSGFEEGFRKGYNKAIDDFIHECDKRCGFYTLGNKILTREDILLIARELKAGGKNE